MVELQGQRSWRSWGATGGLSISSCGKARAAQSTTSSNRIVPFKPILFLCVLVFPGLPSAVAPPPPKQVPEQYQVIISTNAEDGKTCPIVINVTSTWARDSATRFWKMSTADPPLFYDSAFYHVEPGHSAEFGLSGDPTANHDFNMPPVNDQQRYTNEKATVSFVQMDGKANSTRVAINLAKNTDHDSEHFVPFAKVVSGFSSLQLVHTPRLGGLSEWELSTKYLHLGNTWIHQKDSHITLITGVRVVWDGGAYEKGVPEKVCTSGSDYVHMMVGVMEDELAHLEEVSGLSGGATFVVLVASLAGMVGVLCGLVLCYTEWRKRRLLRYSRELEESGVEMVYDDEASLDGTREDLGRGNSREYDREHVRF